MVEPRKASSRCSPAGSSPRWRSKSPTTGRTSSPGNSSATAALAVVRTAGSTSKGTNVRSVPASRSVRSSSRVFSEVPLPSSISVRAPVTAAISVDALLEDRPLGAGRVVLVEPGDLVEELAAAGVVEVLRRQRQRPRRQPGPHVASHLLGQAAGVEVDVGRGERHGVSKGVTVIRAAVAPWGRVTSRWWWSGTSTQRGSSSQGSLATATPSGSTR